VPTRLVIGNGNRDAVIDSTPLLIENGLYPSG